jgi:molecular chaperone GrpE
MSNEPMSNKEHFEQQNPDEDATIPTDNIDMTAGRDTEGLTLQEVLQKLEDAENALQTHKEDVLRVQAEMQNLRRRTEQDVEKAHKYGQERFASELLVVIDNLERTLAAVEDKEDELLKPLVDGVELTLKGMLDCLRRFSIEQVDPLGEPFNPQLHQAVVMQESRDAEPDTVLSVMQKGYTLHGRVIRPAMVIVSRAPSSGADEAV